MKTDEFARHMSAFLTKYLPGEKKLSVNTIAVYRDSFKLFLTFCDKMKNISPEKITVPTLTKSLILEFLDWIEKDRSGSIATRNQRLSSICGFVRYIQAESPDNIYELNRILDIPAKKTAKTIIPYLTEQDLKILFSQPDLKTREGRRDYALLIFLYDTAARVQEIADLKVKNVRLVAPAVVTLHGKGDKMRQVPILDRTKNIINEYVEEYRSRVWGIAFDDAPLFSNQRRQALSRWGVSHILGKYVSLARRLPAFSADFPVTPHVLRHSKAMGMLKAGIPLIYIRDFLGHVNITTTEIYARADNEMKRKYLEQSYPDLIQQEFPGWNEDKGLLAWLNDLCRR
jgi:site-specific recombinase XerD